MSWELPKCSPFDRNKVVRLIGIDPGTNSMGISVFDINVETSKVALIWTITIKGNSFLKDRKDMIELNGERFAKLHGYRGFLIDLFYTWEPNLITCEGNYMGSFPTPYGALTEMVLMIRMAAMAYRSDVAVKIIDPSSVKKAIGVPGNSGDKDLMKKRVKEIDVIFYQSLKIDDMDEHSIDSVAIGYYGTVDYLNF